MQSRSEREVSASSRKLLELQREWDRKLRAAGFDDIEVRPGGDRLDPHMRIEDECRGIDHHTAEDTLTYYQAASALLHDHRWRSARSREIWRLHCEGKSWSEIAETVRCSKLHVQDVIEPLRRRIINRGHEGKNRICVRKSAWSRRTPKKIAAAYLDTIRALATTDAPKAKRGRIPERLLPAPLGS